MDRRGFLRRAAIVAAGVVAADQLELVERLTWRRRLFPGYSLPRLYSDYLHDDTEALNAALAGRDVWDVAANRLLEARHPLYLSGRSFRLTDSLHIRRDRVILSHCCFDFSDAPWNADRALPSGSRWLVEPAHKKTHVTIRDSLVYKGP